MHFRTLECADAIQMNIEMWETRNDDSMDHAFPGCFYKFFSRQNMFLFALFQVICSTLFHAQLPLFCYSAAPLSCFCSSVYSIHFRSFALNILDRHAIKELTVMADGEWQHWTRTSLNFECVYLSVFSWRFNTHTAIVKFYTCSVCVCVHLLRNGESFHNQQIEQQQQRRRGPFSHPAHWFFPPEFKWKSTQTH